MAPVHVADVKQITLYASLVNARSLTTRSIPKGMYIQAAEIPTSNQLADIQKCWRSSKHSLWWVYKNFTSAPKTVRVGDGTGRDTAIRQSSHDMMTPRVPNDDMYEVKTSKATHPRPASPRALSHGTFKPMQPVIRKCHLQTEKLSRGRAECRSSMGYPTPNTKVQPQ